MMIWPARSAIRPVPSYAVVSRDVIDLVESEYDSSGDLETHVTGVFRNLDTQQSVLAGFLHHELDTVHDDTASALGQFLGAVVYQAFANAFGPRLKSVDEATLQSTRANFDWDEELRRGDATELLESDDLVAIGQPHIMTFVREQLDAALEPDEDGDPSDVDLDALSAIYRVVLIEILALGQAVAPPKGTVVTRTVLM
jgi:hypothetical protein